MKTSKLDTQIAKLKTTQKELEEERKLLVERITDLLLWMAKNIPSNIQQHLPCNCRIYTNGEFVMEQHADTIESRMILKYHDSHGAYNLVDSQLEILAKLLVNTKFLAELTEILKSRTDLFKTASEKIKFE